MNTDGIWSNIFRHGKHEESLGEVLHSISLFEDLTSRELRVLEKLVHIRHYRAAEAIFLEAEPGAGMYVLRSGRVDILLKYQTETPVLLAELEPGDFFGEMALLGDSARSASAVAREPSELIGFFHPDLQEIINLHPAMGAKITFGLAKTLADRLRFTNRQVREVWQIRGSNETNSR